MFDSVRSSNAELIYFRNKIPLKLKEETFLGKKKVIEEKKREPFMCKSASKPFTPK